MKSFVTGKTILTKYKMEKHELMALMINGTLTPHSPVFLKPYLIYGKHTNYVRFRLPNEPSLDPLKVLMIDDIGDLYSCLDEVLFDNKEIEYYTKIKSTERHQESEVIITLSQAGQKGGSVSKTHPAFIVTLQNYLEENPQRLKKSDSEICRAFSRKYNGELNACKVKVGDDPWEVYCSGDRVYVNPGERYAGKRAKQKEKSIKLSTFQKYISQAKKSII